MNGNPDDQGMGEIVITVARWLKGQTHVHTDRSYDANTPPDEVVRFYADRGYDFVVLTDHNRVTVAEPAGKMLVLAGAELTQNSTACEPKPPQGYRCLIHTSALFVDPAKDAAAGKKFRMPFVENRRAAYEAQMAFADQLGGVAILNHPSFHFAANARTIAALAGRGLRLVEVINAGLDQQHPKGRPEAERRAEALWDEVLSLGVTVWGVATDDAHHFSDAPTRIKIGKFPYTGDRAWVMVQAEKNATAIREALLAGRFYSTTGVILGTLELAPAELKLGVDAALPPHVFRFVGRDGKELLRKQGHFANYLPRGDEGYVRAVVEAADGNKAWLQPVRVGGDAG